MKETIFAGVSKPNVELQTQGLFFKWAIYYKAKRWEMHPSSEIGKRFPFRVGP